MRLCSWVLRRGNHHLCTSELLTMTFVAECATLLLLVKSCQTGNRFLRQRGPCEFKLLFSNVLTRCTIGTDLQEIFNWNRKALAPQALFYIVCRLLLKWLRCVSTSHSFLYLPMGSETKTRLQGCFGGTSTISRELGKERGRMSVTWELLLEKRKAETELQVTYLWAQYRLLVLISIGHSRKEKSPLCI